MKLRESADFIIVHHSVSSPNTTVAEIRKWHKERKYIDIGYHYVITGDGEIHVGRFEQYAGAHCPQQGMNRRSFGICLTGDFTKARPTPEQYTSLLKLLVDLSYKHAIHADSILGHKEVEDTDTLCPGDLLNMDEVRHYVARQHNKLQKALDEEENLLDQIFRRTKEEVAQSLDKGFDAPELETVDDPIVEKKRRRRKKPKE